MIRHLVWLTLILSSLTARGESPPGPYLDFYGYAPESVPLSYKPGPTTFDFEKNQNGAAGFYIQMFAPPTPTPECARCSLRPAPLAPIISPTPVPPKVAAAQTEAGVSNLRVPRAEAPVRGGDRVASGDAAVTPEIHRPPPPVKVTQKIRPQTRPLAAHSSAIRPSRRRAPEPLTPREHQRARRLTSEERAAERAPIWNSFHQNFMACAPGCDPVGYASWGDRGNRSCHPSGKALDLHAMRCNGELIEAIGSTPRWKQLVECMRGQGMHVLYQNHAWNGGAGKTSGHYDHAHFSNGCLIGGRSVW